MVSFGVHGVFWTVRVPRLSGHEPDEGEEDQREDGNKHRILP